MGVIDLKSVVAANEKIGVEWYNIEQEDYDGEIFPSLEHDVNYVKKLLGR